MFQLRRLLAAGLATAMLAAPAMAELYRVTSVAPGLSPFVVNTAIAKLVAKHVPGVEFQVRATGAATQHFVEAGQGKVDFLFGSSTINWLMAGRIGPFEKMENAPELEKNIGMIFSYQIGPYHYIVDADSGIETLADLKGRTVFAGPPGGAATGVVLRQIEAATGLKPEQDFQVARFGFDAAIQAFQDGKIDLVVLSTNVPSPSVEQFALTKRIRLIGIPEDKIITAATGGTKNLIAADAYGPNQVNTEPVWTHGAIVNFSAGMHVPEEVVYKVTKAIWENVAEMHEAASWMKNVIRKEDALLFIPNRLHPGAERYYREIGMEIPAPMIFAPKP